MGILTTIIIAAFCVYLFGLNMGNKGGRRERERELESEMAGKKSELDSIASALNRRETEISERETAIDRRDIDSRKLHQKEEEYRAKAKSTLVEAQKEFRNAYANGVKKREDELRILIHSLLSQQPNNRHFTHVLSEAETILVMQEIEMSLSERAPVTAKALQQRFAASHKKDRERARFYQFQCELYEELFPELKDYKDDESEIKTDIIKTDETDWLSEDEYNKLSPTERSQLALDRYVKSSNKSKWQIGRDFELFVGSEYRRDGWEVEQSGIRDGVQDLGRDLICKKGQVTHIVQCKYWSQTKTIHEKHIAQLFGTTVAYKYEHPALLAPIQSDFFKDLPRPSIIPVFITSTSVSEQARKFAKALGVTIVDNKKIGDFPRIKCNNTKDGEKIFHLPFDQQYDRTNIVAADGDCYVMTVAEAVEKGYRRAKRHLYEV